jgi:hypothetical protein
MNQTYTNPRPAGFSAPCGRDIALRGSCPPQRWLPQTIRLIVLLGMLLQANWRTDAQPAALTEYQVKALFLLNFTKYIDWPTEAFAETNSPITIGVIGQNNFGEDLAKAVEGKSVNGRKIVLLPLESENDWSKCHILFISASEKKRVPDIVAKVKALPILTVGETEQFTQQGGIVNFTKKEGKVRLEIDLNAAQSAKLQISSRLLNVADVVRGKP